MQRAVRGKQLQVTCHPTGARGENWKGTIYQFGVDKSHLSLVLPRSLTRMITIVNSVSRFDSMAVNNSVNMLLGCSHYTISTLLLISSTVTLVGALALQYELSIFFGNYLDILSSKPIIFLIVGSILMFADACLGIASLARRWYQGLIMFVASTGYLLVTMIIFASIAYLYSVSNEEAIYLRLKEDISSWNIKSIDTIQSNLHCCGYKSYNDYVNKENNIPQSCCTDGAYCSFEEKSKIYSTGCHEALEDFLSFRKWIIAFILAVVGIVEIVSIVLSVALCRFLAREISAESPSLSTNTDNELPKTVVLPRVNNPLGQENSSLSTVGNGNINRRYGQDPYVRRPGHLPVTLTYHSPHENFLRKPPQLRFDRRIVLPNTKHRNPCAAHPG